MKVLVATKGTQGRRASDFSWTKEEELVKFGTECDRDPNRIDGGCGCRRSMVGLETSKATTTFKIVEMDITDAAFQELVHKSYEREGWLKVLTEKDIKAKATELREFADSFPVDMVLEKRGNRIQER